MKYLVLLALVLGSVTTVAANGERPTPQPSVPQPAGDAGVIIEPTPAASPAATPAPTPAPSPAVAAPQLDGDPHTEREPGPVSLVVRACVDTNGDNLCTTGEGLDALPIILLNATNGDALLHDATAPDGRSHLHLVLAERTRLTLDAPYLGRAEQTYSGQTSVELLLPAVELPEVLP
jgi:hypothetical protein